MAREITEEEKELARELLERARAAMKVIENYDQAQVDRLCQAMGWQLYNEKNAIRLVNMAVDESGHGDRAPAKRFKVLGVLRDALRQKSMGIIEEIPEKGITKYAKPAGVVCSLSPTTNPLVTPMSVGIYAIKCKDAVIFGPHPASKKASNYVVHLMRNGTKECRRTRGSAAVRRKPEHSAGAGVDVPVRSDGRDRRRADGEVRLQFGQAGLRRGTGEFDHGHR